MQQVKVLFSFAGILAVLMILVYLIAVVFEVARLPLTHIDFLAISLLLLWVSYRLKVQHEPGSAWDQMRGFALFFLFFGLFLLTLYLFPLLALLFLPGSFSDVTIWSHRLSHIFLFIGMAFLIRVTISWYNPKLKNIGFAAMILLGAYITYVAILAPGGAYLHTSGINIRDIDPFVAKIIAISAIIGFVPAAVYFLYRSIRTKERLIRVRAALLGIGLIVITIGGPLHNIAQDPTVFLLADLATLLGVVIMAAGILYKDGKEEKAIEK